LLRRRLIKKLLSAYSDLEKIYERLDNLIRIALIRAICFEEGIECCEERVTHRLESEYDVIAYSDAVNRRFEFYYKKVIKFLELFFQERYGIYICNTKELFDLCHQKEFINDEELRDCIRLIEHIRLVRSRRNKIGDYVLTEGILFYTVLLNDLAERVGAHVKKLPQ